MEHNLTGMARVADGMMRAGPLQHVPALLKALGTRPEPLLRTAGLSQEALLRAENVIPVGKALRFLVACAARTGRQHFGLLAGQRSRLEQYGLVGLRMLNAPTVGTAWRGMVLTLHLNGRVMVPALTVHDGVAILSFSYYGEEIEGAYHASDFSIAGACTAMRILCGPKWTPTETHIGHRGSIDRRPYRQFFKSPVRFGMSRTALLFPAAWLGRPIIGANLNTRKTIEQTIADMLRQQDLPLTSKVRRAVFSQMTQDDVSIEGVARLLGTHKRTLNRRLAEERTSFAKLLGEVRFQIARQLLAETDLSFTDVAAALNYTDASTFSRAFRSWAGTTPSGWRQVNAI